MKTIYKIIITIAGILIFCAVVGAYFDIKKDLKTSRENTSQLINETRQNKQLYLTKDQIKRYISESNETLLKTALDSFKIKAKNIVKTYNNRYYYHYTDTIIEAEKNDSIFSTKYAPDSCISLDVLFDGSNFIFENVVIDYESETIYFKIRETKSGRRIFWPLGQKKIKAETVNNCTGETKITEINVIK